MRSFYSIRSIGLGSLALVATLLALAFIQVPASAEVVPLDAGYHLKVSQAPDFVFVIHNEVLPAAEVARLDRAPAFSVVAFADPRPMKPEYAESYETSGLNLIELRRRC